MSAEYGDTIRWWSDRLLAVIANMQSHKGSIFL